MSTNGSGNGHDPDDKKIVSFPSLAERDRMKRAEREEEERWRKEYKKQSKANREPFFKFGNVPPFSKYLVAALIIVHAFLYLILDAGTKLQIIYFLGFIPGKYTGTFEFDIGAFLSPIAHVLVHGSSMHLLFNAIMGLVLGMYFEKMFGTRSTIKFFLACTLAGVLAFFIIHPFSITPVVGASGAISGFFGAFIYLAAQNQQHPLTQRFGKHGPWPILIFWGLLIVVPGLLMGGQAMAWEAHLGGYACGIALLLAQKKGLIKFI